MNRKERVQRQMEEMWGELVQKRSNAEWVKSRLQWEDWESLGREAVAFAKQELRRRRWRGARGGVVPRGYGPEDIAWEVIGEVVEGQGRIGAGWTRERLLKELERLVSGKVRLLCSLKETRAMRNEWDIAPRKTNGEPVSVLSKIAGAEQTGYDAAVEAEEGRESLRTKIEAQLSGEPDLKALFGCLCDGETRTREIARRLGTSEQAVVLARRRLATRLKRLRRAGLVEHGGAVGQG